MRCRCLYDFLIEMEGLLAVGFVGNDGLGAAPFEPLAQRCAVVSLVAEMFLCRLGAADQALGRRTIMRLAAAQEEVKKTAFSICDCVGFRIAPAARASNSLRLLPFLRQRPSGAL